jgi:hypothetical protein
MEQTGPVVDQLSNEVLHALGQFLVEESFYDVALNWLQQVVFICPLQIILEKFQLRTFFVLELELG